MGNCSCNKIPWIKISSFQNLLEFSFLGGFCILFKGRTEKVQLQSMALILQKPPYVIRPEQLKKGGHLCRAPEH